jgi:RNA polymerase sigma factor (TIGR02999 family)
VEPVTPEAVTQLLIRWSQGDRAALDQLTPLVYDELRRVARNYMRREPTDHTLQTTALVNEAYIRLIDQDRVHWQNRAHFFGIAAQLMRRILVDHARKRHNLKRGGDVRRIPLEEAFVVADEQAADLVALDDALQRLQWLDERKGRVVELRFFGGLNIEEAAEVLSVSPATIQREWAMAKAWLYREITERQ